MRNLLAALLFASTPVHAGWEAEVQAQTAGDFPDSPSFNAEYRLGWSEIEAARAWVSVTRPDGRVCLNANGGTYGAVRLLYQLDAAFTSLFLPPDFQTQRSDLVETYSDRTLTTSIVGGLGELWSLSDSTRHGKSPAKWHRVKVVPARDLFAGMFFIRSQRLLAGDEVAVVIYPGGAPFLARVKSLGTEAIVIAGQKREAIKLDLTIQRVNVKKGNILEPHDKFQSGKIWVSNDTDRIPLRAEVNIFVGYVFGELVSFDKQ